MAFESPGQESPVGNPGRKRPGSKTARFKESQVQESQVQESQVMKAQVTVTLKPGILDPQGKAIEGALKALGIEGIANVRQGKVFDFELAEGDRARAEARLKAAAEQLLANTVIENYDVKIIG